MPPRRTEKYTTLYGLRWPNSISLLEVELNCFLKSRSIEQCGLGRYKHFVNAAKLLWPKLQWHDWMVTRIKTLCDPDNEVNTWVGCASAGKTFDAGLFGLVWWAANPHESAVIMTSTTGKSVRRRMWPVIQELYSTAERIHTSPMFEDKFYGNLVDSRTTLQAAKGDDKHCVVALAVADGPVHKAVSNIKGYHPKRLLIIIDEANDTPEAIFYAVSNLKKGLNEFKVIIIGNPVSRMDPHGLCAEPALGWNSVSMEATEWPTKGVQKWELSPGICLRFDGEQSPNIKVGKREFPFLISESDVTRSRRDSGEHSIYYWSNTRGWWPPEGSLNGVMTESLVINNGGLERGVIWPRGFKWLGGLDPSFTAEGDDCILRFGKFGQLDDGRYVLELDERIRIPLVAGEDTMYQIARRTIQECKDRGMTPADLGLDTTGGGKGVADVISREWGYGIHRVGFGEKASEEPVSYEDIRPSHEVYSNRVSELWYICRQFVESGQLKGLDTKTVGEFCNRNVKLLNKRILIAPKDECKKELGHSPNDADACAVLVDVARQHGLVRGSIVGGVTIKGGNQSWEDQAKDFDQVYDENALAVEQV